MSDSFQKQARVKLKGTLVSLARFASYSVVIPIVYKLAARHEVNDQKVLFVVEKGDKVPGSYSVILPFMQLNCGCEAHLHFMGINTETSRAQRFLRAVRLARDASTAKVVFLDDASREISCLPLRDETKAVQLWHACGAFKKWGASTEGLLFGDSLKEVKKHPYYANLDLVTVSSPEVVWAYEEAMLLDRAPEVVQPLGVSRTDVFFDNEFIEESFRELYRVIPETVGKKVLLYAPTFRGSIEHAKAPDCLEIEKFADSLGGEWVLLIKHHPFVKDRPEIPDDCKCFAFDVSDQIEIEKLLIAADLLVTDYSSVVFEYSLTARPMCFFAYDFEEYLDWRGFYYSYDEMTPGPVVRTSDEVIQYVKTAQSEFDQSSVEVFRDKFMRSCDGHSTRRIAQWLGFGE